MRKTIKELVRELAGNNEDKLTFKELLSSKQFETEAENAVFVLTHKRIKVVATAGRKGATAYTNGDQIVVETEENPLVNYFANVKTAYYTVMGTIFHEAGHILYTDFGALGDAIDDVRSGRIPYGENLGSEADFFRKCLADEQARNVVLTLYHSIINVVLDPHDEALMIKHHGPFVARAIETVQEALRSRAKPLEHQECDAFGSLMNLSLYYARFGEIHVLTKEFSKKNRYVEALKQAVTWLDTAVGTDDEEVRYDAVNHIVMLYLPLIVKEQEEEPEQPEKQTDGSKGSENDSSKGPDPQKEPEQEPKQKPETLEGEESEGDTEEPKLSQEKAEKLIRSIKDAVSSVGSNEIDPEAGKELASGIADEVKGNGSGDVSDGFERVKKEATEEMVSTHLDELLDHATMREIQNVPMDGLNVKPAVFPDIVQPTAEGERKYRSDMDILRPYIRQLQKQVENVLRDLEDGGIDKDLPYGKSIIPERSYRRDGRYFANRNTPQDIPETAISVLIDNSGSMEFGRIDSAKRAALLLYLAAKEMDIPISVCLHNTDYNRSVEYHVAVDYEDRRPDGAVRIESQTPYGCNHDGAALRISAERLLNRPEEIKLLFLISDGLPNGFSYRGDVAAEDLRKIVREYKKQGVEFFAACMGEDQENIRSIYQDDFIAIDDPAKLPKVFSKILSRKLLDR